MTTRDREKKGFTYRLRGALTAENAEAVRDQVAQAYGTGGRGDLILDMSGVDFMDSMGIGVLVSLSRTVSGRGGTLRLCGLQPSPRMVLEITRIDRIIPIYPTAMAAAMAAAS